MEKTAEFIGWQDRSFVGMEPYPMYNIPTEYGGMTTVGALTVLKKGYRLPSTPCFFEWEEKNKEKNKEKNNEQ